MSRLRLVLLSLAALVAFVLLGATLAVYLAKDAIIEKAESLGASMGLTVAIGDVDVPLLGGIGLKDVQVRNAEGIEIARLDRIDTDVSLVGAALGRRRPGRIELVGGSAVLRWDDGPIDLVRSRGAGGDPGAAEPIAVTVTGLALRIESRQSTPLGKVEVEPLLVEGLALELTRDAARAVAVEASGVLVSASHRSAVRVVLDTAGAALSFAAEDGVEVGLQTPHGPMWVALNGLERRPDRPLAMAGLGVRLGDRLLQVETATLRGGGSGLIPDARTLEGLDARGIAARRGDDRVRIAEASLSLTASPRGPMPTRVLLTRVEGEARQGERAISGRIAALEVGLTDLARHLEVGRPLDALSALRLERPEATLVLPAVVESPTTNGAPPSPPAGQPGSARPSVVDDQGQPGSARPSIDDPPPFLGNDDELPPAEAVVPALAAGRDWLGVLLGSEESEGATIDALVPAELRARLPEHVARLGALAPNIDHGSLRVVDTEGKALLSLEDAGMSASREGDGVAIGLRAAVLRDGKEAGRADLRLGLTADLTLDSLEGTLSGKSLAHQLARFVSHLSVQEDAEVDLAIRYERPRDDNAPHHVTGTLRLASFSFEFWRIADREIRDLEATVSFEASIDRKAHRLLLTLPEIKVGEATLSASLDLTRPKRHLPRFVAKVEMPRQDCAAAARSIPKGLIPNLPTLALAGRLDFKASLTLDLENPRDLDLEVTGDGEDCRILSLGPDIDLEALRGDFVHHPREPKRGVLEHIEVGRGTGEWVDSEKIPDIVKAAAWVTEDRRWTEHRGVRWDLVERALKIDLEHGRFIYGGSTITQQLVKNLYLTRDKNLARKLEEAIISWQMERVLSKDEILTIYINCIEYGPDIYGIKQAARIYFGKRPHDLDALEAAFIMGLKPYPKAGYNQFMKGTLDTWWVRRVSHVLRYMAKFAPEHITLEEAEAFAPFQPAFRTP